MPPVPRLDGIVDAVLPSHVQQAIAFRRRTVLRRRPDLVCQARDVLARRRHRVGHAELGVGRIAQQPGPLLPQRQDLGDQHPIVVRAGVLPARDPGKIGHAPKIAEGREGQERFDRRPGQSDHIGFLPPLRRRLPRALAHELRQALQIFLSQGQMPFLLVMHDVLAELGMQRGEPLGYFRHARLLRLAQPSAVAHEAEMPPFKQAQRVRRQAQRLAPAIERVDPGEQAGIERHAHAVLRQFWGEIEVDRLQFRRAEAGDQIAEHVADALQQPAATLQRLDRVGETGGGRIGGDRLDFGDMFGHAALQRLRKMLRADAVERRHAEGGGPGLEKRIAVHPQVVPKRTAMVKLGQSDAMTRPTRRMLASTSSCGSPGHCMRKRNSVAPSSSR